MVDDLLAQRRVNRRLGDGTSEVRTTQNRAENSSMASDLDAHAKRLTVQGRWVITNLKHKHWHLVAEVSASRAKLAHVKTDTNDKVHMAMLQQKARLSSAGASGQNQVPRAQQLEVEFRSARAEANELSASRPSAWIRLADNI